MATFFFALLWLCAYLYLGGQIWACADPSAPGRDFCLHRATIQAGSSEAQNPGLLRYMQCYRSRKEPFIVIWMN